MFHTWSIWVWICMDLLFSYVFKVIFYGFYNGDSSPLFTTIWGIFFVPTTASKSTVSFLQLLHSSRVFCISLAFTFVSAKGSYRSLFFWIWSVFEWTTLLWLFMTQIWRCFRLIFLYLCHPSRPNHVPFRKGNCSKTLSFCMFSFQSSGQSDFYDCFRWGNENIQLICRVWLTCLSFCILSGILCIMHHHLETTIDDTLSNMESTPDV